MEEIITQRDKKVINKKIKQDNTSNNIVGGGADLLYSGEQLKLDGEDDIYKVDAMMSVRHIVQAQITSLESQLLQQLVQDDQKAESQQQTTPTTTITTVEPLMNPNEPADVPNRGNSPTTNSSLSLFASVASTAVSNLQAQSKSKGGQEDLDEIQHHDEQLELIARQKEALEQVKQLQCENEELKKQIIAQQKINERLERSKTQIVGQILEIQPQDEQIGVTTTTSSTNQHQLLNVSSTEFNTQQDSHLLSDDYYDFSKDQDLNSSHIDDPNDVGNTSQYDLESEAIIDWASHEDNKIEIKYYDASEMIEDHENHPIKFYYNLTKFDQTKSAVPKIAKQASIVDTGLSFNKLVLVENSFTEHQWLQLRLLISLKFSQVVKRIRIWDCGICQLSNGDELQLEKAKMTTEFNASIVPLLKTLRDFGGLQELDLQYLSLNAEAIDELALILRTVKYLKRLTFIREESSDLLDYVSQYRMTNLVDSLNSNETMQLESLVFYGLDLSAFEAGRSLAHFMAKQQRLKTLRLQECSLQGKALFAILTSIRKTRSIYSLEKLMISMNQLDTQESVVTLCGLVKEATYLRSLCTFFTGVIIQWPGAPRIVNIDHYGQEALVETNSNDENKDDPAAIDIVAFSEKKNEEVFRLSK